MPHTQPKLKQKKLNVTWDIMSLSIYSHIINLVKISDIPPEYRIF